MRHTIAGLGRQTAWYGLAHALTGVASLALLLFYTHRLAPPAMGLYALLRLMLAAGHIVYQHGMEVGFLRYFTPEPDPARRCTLVSTARTVLSAWGGCGTAVLWWKAGAVAPAGGLRASLRVCRAGRRVH